MDVFSGVQVVELSATGCSFGALQLSTSSVRNVQALQTAAQSNDGIMTPDVAQNVANNTPALSYTVELHRDMQGAYDLNGSSCFSVQASSPDMKAVDECLQKKTSCCMFLTAGSVVSVPSTWAA